MHKSVHVGLKLFACPEDGCDKKFSDRSGLRYHKKAAHSGERPYGCPQPGCGACYRVARSHGSCLCARSSLLHLHITLVSAGKGFIRRQSLMNHLEQHRKHGQLLDTSSIASLSTVAHSSVATDGGDGASSVGGGTSTTTSLSPRKRIVRDDDSFEDSYDSRTKTSQSASPRARAKPSSPGRQQTVKSPARGSARQHRAAGASSGTTAAPKNHAEMSPPLQSSGGGGGGNATSSAMVDPFLTTGLTSVSPTPSASATHALPPSSQSMPPTSTSMLQMSQSLMMSQYPGLFHPSSAFGFAMLPPSRSLPTSTAYLGALGTDYNMFGFGGGVGDGSNMDTLMPSFADSEFIPFDHVGTGLFPGQDMHSSFQFLLHNSDMMDKMPYGALDGAWLQCRCCAAAGVVASCPVCRCVRPALPLQMSCRICKQAATPGGRPPL